MSRTFKPNMDEINKIPQPFLSEWIEALKTSRQHKRELTDGKGAYCCLGIACKVVGVADEGMYYSESDASLGVPTNAHFDLIGVNLHDLNVTDCKRRLKFAQLNDKHLTHPQIAELLSGNEVTIEDAA